MILVRGIDWKMKMKRDFVFFVSVKYLRSGNSCLFTSCVFCVLRINVFFQLFESCFIKGNNFEQHLEAYRNNCMGIDV